MPRSRANASHSPLGASASSNNGRRSIAEAIRVTIWPSVFRGKRCCASCVVSGEGLSLAGCGAACSQRRLGFARLSSCNCLPPG